MFVFLMFFALLDILSKKNIKDNIVISIFPFVVLCILSGLRWKTGNDWNAYYDFYLQANSVEYHSSSYEYGYRSMVQIFKGIGFDYSGFLLFISLLQLLGFYFFYNKLKYPSFLLFIYFCTYYLGFMGTLRQTVAISFFLLGLSFLISNGSNFKKKSSYLICIILASLFHISAIVCLVVIFVPKKKFPSLYYLSVLLFCYLISNLIIPVVLDIMSNFTVFMIVKKIQDYATIKNDLHEQNSLVIMWYIKKISFACLFYFILSFVKSKVYAYLYNIYFCSLIIFISFINIMPILAIRGGEYFTILEIVFFCALVANITCKKQQIIAFSLFCTLFGARLYNSIHSYHPDLFIPYYSVISKGDVTRTMY